MKKLSFLTAVCAAVFAFSSANAQITDTTRNETDTSVVQDTIVRPDKWDKTDQDTVKGTLDNGRDRGIRTDTTDIVIPPSNIPDIDRGTDDNGMGTGTNGNDNGLGTGTNGTGTNRTGTGTDRNR